MSRATLWIDPPSYHFERDRLFDITGAPNSGDGILAPYVHLRSVLASRDVAVHTADLLDGSSTNGGASLYVSTGMTKRFRSVARRGDVIMSAFLVLECPVVARPMFAELPEADRLFRRMFAFNDGGALKPFLATPISFEPIRYPYPSDGVDERAWSRTERSFLAMINANKAVPSDRDELYSRRLDAIAFFAQAGDLNLYGMGWDGPAYRVGRTTSLPGTIRRLARRVEHEVSRLRPDPRLVAARSVWRGRVDSKLEVLSRHRFSICIENQLLDGWITEKLLDCLRAGCIPVYLGAPDVERWIPRDCFVDMREFDSYAQLRAHLRALTQDEVRAYREAGREFLTSERFRPFSKQAFADVFVRMLAEDAGVEV